jgi:hypothetical protein
MKFGEALEYVLSGAKAWREGWNGKGMYIAVQPGSVIENSNARGGVALSVAAERPGSVTINPHIDMKTAQGDVAVGWTPSQADMFADDWAVQPGSAQ